MKKFTALVLAIVLVLSLGACASTEKTQVRAGLLKGPTGIGAAYLMEQAANEKTSNSYTFKLASAPTEIVSAVVAGELDIAAVPTNLASTLYKKTEGGVQILALNTLGVLYILAGEGVQINSVADLAGKTLYATGQASNPEYVLNYILRENGLEPGSDVEIVFKESDELATLMAAGEIDLCMLPVPNATSVLIKNPEVSFALNLTEEWNKVTEDGSQLTMGCVIARKEFVESNPKAVENFLAEYETSINYVKNNVEAASELVAKYEITGSAAVAAKAIPDCSLVCITGEQVKTTINGYYEVLFAADPAAIGGAVPDDGFYYEK